MKSTLKIFCLLSIAACSNFPINNIAPGYADTFKAINNAVFGFNDEKIDPMLIQNIPYASMLLKIGKGPQGLLILESKKEEQTIWVSADNIYLVLKDGVIIKSSGLFNNLKSTINRNFPVKKILNNNIQGQTFYYSYDNPELRNLKIEVKYKLEEEEEVTILGKKMLLRLITETGGNHYIGWKFQNKYWIDENLDVLKSEQSISPKLPTIKYMITKKPS